MLLKNNSIAVINLIKLYENLNEKDKLKLAIYILENPNFYTKYDLIDTINILKKAFKILDSRYNNSIINFSKYKNLLYYCAKYIELSINEKKQFIIEILFNIYNTNFNDKVNSLINNKLLIYEIYYNLF